MILGMCVSSAMAVNSILDCKSFTPGKNMKPDQELANSECWKQTVLAANASATDRVALIPKGVKVSMLPFAISDLVNVTFRIDGTVYASLNWKHWPVGAGQPLEERGEEDVRGEDGRYQHFWNIYDS